MKFLSRAEMLKELEKTWMDRGKVARSLPRLYRRFIKRRRRTWLYINI